MSKKYLFWWAVWIGAWGGIYSMIYSLLPLPDKSIMWMTFVSLPIYFTAGAKREEFPNYVFSMIMGVIWGVIFLYFIGVLTHAGINVPITMLLDVGILTIACCAIHFCITGTIWVNKVPMMFGAIALTFSQNGQNLPTVLITLFFGITLGLIMQEGTTLLTKWGVR